MGDFDIANNVPVVLNGLNERVEDDDIGGSLHSISSTMAYLQHLSDAQLAVLLTSKEGNAKIKERIVSENALTRPLLVSGLGKLMIRVWIVLHSDNFDIEGYVRVEARSEARRLADDFLDTTTDSMKCFAKGVIGQAPAQDSSQTLEDSFSARNAYAEVIFYLFDLYCGHYEQLNDWSDALSGLSGSGSKQVHLAAGQTTLSSALSLLPLIKAVVGVAFRDRYELISYCREVPAYYCGRDKQSFLPQLVSSFMRLLLTGMTRNAASSIELQAESLEHSASIFAVSAGPGGLGSGTSSVANIITGSSRDGPFPLPVQPYIAEWVENSLLFMLQNASSAEELVKIIRDIICITQHSLMADLRAKVCFALNSTCKSFLYLYIVFFFQKYQND